MRNFRRPYDNENCALRTFLCPIHNTGEMMILRPGSLVEVFPRALPMLAMALIYCPAPNLAELQAQFESTQKFSVLHCYHVGFNHNR